VIEVFHENLLGIYVRREVLQSGKRPERFRLPIRQGKSDVLGHVLVV
jgi:hypothetical protein